jgi:hypothetical protein
MKNVYLWYVTVEGAKMAVVLGREDLAGPGNTFAMYNIKTTHLFPTVQNATEHRLKF